MTFGRVKICLGGQQRQNALCSVESLVLLVLGLVRLMIRKQFPLVPLVLVLLVLDLILYYLELICVFQVFQDRAQVGAFGMQPLTGGLLGVMSIIFLAF